ncbi:hypothetical protein BV898_15989 [Hypsibius exemplaris]|uniref:Uncharacterized protein n=1 Tax=Hypsibius exemplaris TaxID=2072580 RepID=A0A9X6NCA4_HYPEX|nr:hypothetical protein BV898_15989 [Hypsibius exemplaris]
MNILNRLRTLQLDPKRSALVKGILYAELAIATVAGSIHYVLTSRQDARRWLYDRKPTWMIKFYDWTTPTDVESEIRKLDETTWGVKLAGEPRKESRRETAARQSSLAAETKKVTALTNSLSPSTPVSSMAEETKKRMPVQNTTSPATAPANGLMAPPGQGTSLPPSVVVDASG